MELNYEKLKNEVVDRLKKTNICVLSTSLNDYVTSRSMSIVNIGLDVYFQTNKVYIKYAQIKSNNNVSLCFDNISIEGIAVEMGSWKEKKNCELLELYKSKHLGSFNAYGMLDGQIVYKIVPKKIKMWKYIDGKPIRQNLYIDTERAEQLDFM